jgi:trehalose-phosphatase
LPKLRLRLNQQLVGTGALVENKGLTISVHYRNAQPKLTSTILSKVRLVLEDYDMFEASYGKKVIDVRPRLTWNKGTAVQLLMQHEGLYPIIYVGDDYTDEDAFVELNDAIKILVSRHPETSNATYYLKSPLDVARFLRLINLWLQEMDSEL